MHQHEIYFTKITLIHPRLMVDNKKTQINNARYHSAMLICIHICFVNHVRIPCRSSIVNIVCKKYFIYMGKHIL